MWNTGFFENVRIEGSLTPSCVQLVVIVREKQTIREINYKGLNAITLSDVQERFKKAKVGLSVESQYDPTRIYRAIAVLKDLLAEHGHQFATINYVVKTIPPASVGITFNIKEGPTVKVGKIAFTGNYNLPSRVLRDAMINTKPIGVPHSIILENLFARTFDASKLDEDTQRVQRAYQDHGYFKVQVSDPETHVRDSGGINIFTLRPSNGKRIDILTAITEGDRYRLGGITFSGNKAVPNTRALRAQFAQKDGEYFNVTLFGKGLEALRKAYGGSGYINMVPSPVPHFDETKKLISWNIDIDEGQPYYVSRIEFSGNTITRDKVIRRELLLEEGQLYSSQRWDLSIQRLNQLSYFEPLKAEQDSETRQNAEDHTVDLLLKLKEKGKNSIGVNGGISGLSGTFVGLNYETNNFLGLGETLSVNANIGDLSRNLSFGFNEPYLRNKPISLGVEVFTRKYDYNPAKAYSISNNTPANLSNAQQSLLTNYNQSTTGFTTSASEPLKHLWANHGVARVGVTYALSRASVTTFNDNTRNVFQSLAFRSGVQGPNQLNGIITSTIAPSFTYSSLDRGIGPHAGRDFNVSVQVAGAGRQCEVHFAGAVVPAVLPDEAAQDRSRRAQRAGYAPAAGACERLWRRGRTSDQSPVWRRRKRCARLRHPGCIAVHVYPGQCAVQPDESGRNDDSTRSDSAEPGERADSAADLPAGFGGRRFAIDGERGVPHHDADPAGDVCLFHGFWSDGRSPAGTTAAERRGCVGAVEPAVWLPYVCERRVLWGAEGQLPDRTEDSALHQLCSAHVQWCGAAGDPADRECAVPAVLRL